MRVTTRRRFIKSLLALPPALLIGHQFYWRVVWKLNDRAILAERKRNLLPNEQITFEYPGSNTADIRKVLVEEHHQIFPAWWELLQRGARGLTLVHFDAHPDLGVPVGMDWRPLRGQGKSLHTPDWDQVNRVLSIQNFIIPAIYLGLIGEMIHVVPDWGDYSTFVQNEYWIEVAPVTTGFRTRSPRYPYYGITDGDRNSTGIWEPFARLPGTRVFRLEVVRMRNFKQWPAYSLLDVDFDVFSCLNPFRKTRPETHGRLPHHISSPKGLGRYLDRFEKIIERQESSPVLVTMSRSVTSGFTPPHQVGTIQTRVRDVVDRYFP